MRPYFSVIIPLYNKHKYIAGAIDSVLSQTFTDFEIVVVNDGSTDKGEATVSAYNDPRIKLMTTKNKGVSQARNLGAEEAKSDFLVFLDADDIWYENHLSDLKFLLGSYPNCGMYCKAYDKNFLHSKQTTHLKSFPNQWHGIVENYFESASKFSVATSSSVLIPKSIFNAVKGFNSHYNSGEDTDLWIKIALQYSIAFYNNVSVSINMHSKDKVTFKSSKALRHFDLDNYTEQARNNLSLDKYLNLNRFSWLLKLKAENRADEVRVLKGRLDTSHLNGIQKILVNSPNWLLKLAFAMQHLGKRINFHLTPFK